MDIVIRLQSIADHLPECAPAHQACKDGAREIEQLRAVLTDIANPIGRFQREASAAGREVNGGMAIMLADDPHYLRGLAKAALRSVDGQSSNDK